MGQKYKYSVRKYEYCQLNIIKKEKKVLFLFIFKEKWVTLQPKKNLII